MVHEIWMLFISPANPDSSGRTPQTPSLEKNYRNTLGSLSCRTHIYTSHWHGRKHKKSQLYPPTGKPTNTLLPYTNTHTHWGGERARIPRLVSVYLKTRGSCESSQVGLLCMYMGARKTLLTAVRHFDCPARLLHPKPPNTPTSQHLPLPSLARWLFFFFFNCLWALAPLLYHTKSLRWLGGAKGLGALRGQMVRR